jgi:polyphosphate kinase 2 (PPK2 family)
MNFCTEAETASFLRQAPAFEQMLVDDGILLFKYWLTVDQALQEERIAERRADPLKRWKLSSIDLQAREKYAEYGSARDTMLAATHTEFAPWTLVNFNDQRRGRLTLLRHLLDGIPEHKVPEILVDIPPLGHPPLTEKLKKRFTPI